MMAAFLRKYETIHCLNFCSAALCMMYVVLLNEYFFSVNITQYVN